MDASERERNLRRTFGPPVGPPPPAPRRFRPPRPTRSLVAGLVAVAAVAAMAVTAFAVTPHDHVAPGCFWWTARVVGEVTLGQRGCARGVVTVGSGLAEGTDPDSPVLPMVFADPNATRPNVTCPLRPGDAVVVRYHTAFDDGRTFVVVDDCR